VHLIFANIFVGAKHDLRKSLLITNKLPAVMLRPCHIEMHPCIPHFFTRKNWWKAGTILGRN
ncbi:hypothetical protein QT974_11760, partial [Microcoleus sp. herbarium12]